MNRRDAARAALLSVCALTSFYALLCYLPFSWANFVRNGGYPDWLGLFVRRHAVFAAGALALAGWTLTGRARGAWIAGSTLILGLLVASGGLAALGHTPSSLMAAFVAFVPYYVWEALVAVEGDEAEQNLNVPALFPLHAGLLCALGGWLGRLAASGVPPRGERLLEAMAFSRSALVHAAVFLGASLLADASAALPTGPRRLLRAAALWAAAIGMLRLWVFDSLAFAGPAAWAYATALGGALALSAARARPTRLARAAAATPTRRLAALVMLAAAPAAAHLGLRAADWNRLIETLATLSVWAAAWLLLSRFPGNATPESAFRRRVTAALAVIALLWSAEASTRLFDPLLRARFLLAPEAVRLLAERDASFAAARRLLDVSTADDFTAELRRHTNLPDGSVRPSPVAPLPPPAAPPPHLFIFVVDSLRRDRVGAYASASKITPNIDAFARDADKFLGYSAYGGTALSEASIWSGASLPHLQYPRPFAPLNALEAMVDAAGYRPLVTWDTIIERLLDPAKAALALDKGSTGNYKLCATLNELDSRLDAELAHGRPLFVYTQPQDIHVSVLARERATYEGRLKELDACFGRFTAALKARGLYDRSVIVLTADHGDSLGEGGRWGHAYTIYPEILRVPLIVRLPAALRAGLQADLDAPAFLTDLTPSLFAAFGIPFPGRGEPYGRALYASSRSELDAGRREERLVASSYGPVYGVLGGGGEWLYISDAVSFQSYWYDLRADPAGKVNLIDPEREELGRAAARRLLISLRRRYGY